MEFQSEFRGRRHPGQNLLAALLVAGVAWAGASSYAQEKAGVRSDAQIQERLGFLENALNSGQPRAKTWWYGWLSGYTAGAVVMGGLAAGHWNDTKLDPRTQARVRDRGFAEDMLVGSGTFVLGVGGLLVDPFVPACAPNRLRSMPEATAEERRLKLEKAEEILRECAKREREGRGWLTHLLNFGANAAAGLVTVWVFDRPWSDGLLTFATGEAVSLVNIYSQPRRAIRDLEAYESRAWGEPAPSSAAPASDGGLHFGLYPGGFCLRWSF